MSQDLQKRIFDYFDSHAFASNYTVGVNQEGKLVIKGIEKTNKSPVINLIFLFSVYKDINL